MGYESRFYVVEKSNLASNENGLRWAEVIAMYDMSKVYCISGKIRNKFPKTDVYIYSDDGDTEITEDRYGEPLTEISLEDMIKILKEVETELSDYRRYKPFKKMIEGFISERSRWGDLVVLHYGY